MKYVGGVALSFLALLTVRYKHVGLVCNSVLSSGDTMNIAGFFWQYCAVVFLFGQVPLRIHNYWDCCKVALKSGSFVWLLSSWNIFTWQKEGIFLPLFRHPATCGDRTRRRAKWNNFNIISVYEKPQKKENIFWKILHMYILHCIVLQTNLHQIHDIF